MRSRPRPARSRPRLLSTWWSRPRVASMATSRAEPSAYPQIVESRPRNLWLAGDHVHQATGMISAQLSCDRSEALGRLQIVANAMGEDIELTALDVLDGILHFDP